MYIEGDRYTHHGEVADFVGDGAAVVFVVQRVRFTHRYRVVERAHLLYVLNSRFPQSSSLTQFTLTKQTVPLGVSV